MLNFVVSSQLWVSHQRETLEMIDDACDSHELDARTILLDGINLKRFNCEQLSRIHQAIDLRSWVTEGVVEGGIVDSKEVRRFCSGASSLDIVVLNASGFPLEVIVSALNNLRIGLYTEADWPLAFLLVVDGASVYESASILSECFYIQPHRVRGKALDRLIKRMMWKAMILRFFGREGIASRVWRRINLA